MLEINKQHSSKRKRFSGFISRRAFNALQKLGVISYLFGPQGWADLQEIQGIKKVVRILMRHKTHLRSSMIKLDENKICGICHEKYKNLGCRVKLDCRHDYCITCIKRLCDQTDVRCPYCQKAFNPYDFDQEKFDALNQEVEISPSPVWDVGRLSLSTLYRKILSHIEELAG